MLLLKRTTAVLLGLVPLMLVGVGVVMGVREVRPHDPSWYSVRGETVLSDAFLYAAVGCVGLFGCRRLWRTDARWKWTLVPIAVMVVAVAIPNFKYGHHGSPLDRASFNMLQRLSTFAASSKQLAQEQGQFTCDPSVELFGPSHYMQNGQPLPRYCWWPLCGYPHHFRLSHGMFRWIPEYRKYQLENRKTEAKYT